MKECLRELLVNSIAVLLCGIMALLVCAPLIIFMAGLFWSIDKLFYQTDKPVPCISQTAEECKGKSGADKCMVKQEWKQ